MRRVCLWSVSSEMLVVCRFVSLARCFATMVLCIVERLVYMSCSEMY